MLKIALLGQLAITRGTAEPLDLATRKAGALLAVLALTPGFPRSRDHVASLLWGGTTDDKARNSLRQCVFVLRRALGPDAGTLALRGDALWLEPDGVDVDVVAFEGLARGGTRPDLEAAAALMRGDLLEGFSLAEPAFDDWLADQRERLRAAAIDVSTRLLRVQEAAGDAQDAIHTALRLLRLDPLQEAVHRTLMRLYARLGRRGEALRQFRVCADVMARELGVAPEAETEYLRQEILVDDDADSVLARDGEPARAGDQCAILVVEDDPVSREMLRGVLSTAGYRVAVAADGREALVQLGRQRFDLVISDITMPRLDGLSLLEATRRHGRPVPTVLVTAGLAEELEVRALELGARDYLRKPISRDVLLLRVANVLARP